VVVFNIRGNRYRLVAAVDDQLGIVNVLRVMTHEEYSRNRWKDVV
jgi:mRNA-degrading endonuclease HigB of HigAB toxin-antitoxin module